MAVRPIDAIELQRRMCALCNQDYSDEPCEPSDCVFIRAINDMPALTPPNEALTLEQLREMDGQPVWVDDEKIWALLQVWDDDNIDVVFPMPRGCFHAKSVLGKKIYRRPPEGEEDT